MSDSPEEPKIVVDDDWKERVRAEREAARAARKAEDEKPDSEQSRTGGRAQTAQPDSFTMLVSMLATQAMVALGKIPDPAQGHAVVRPSHARQAIDMIAMLEEKTKGNLAADEAEMLSDLLHEMRMLYVSVYKSPQGVSKEPPKEDTPQAESQPQ